MRLESKVSLSDKHSSLLSNNLNATEHWKMLLNTKITINLDI
jgi:hypothetical protein